MRIERLKPAPVWDSTPYHFAQAVRVRQSQDLLFIAGQAGIDESGQIMEGLEAQVKQAFENIRRIVIDAGGSMSNVVRITSYLRDMKALDVYTKIVSEFFAGNLAAATVVEVKALALEPLLVEVDAIAVL